MDAIHKLMLTMRSARGLLSIFLLTTYTASFGASSAIGQTLWPVNGHRYLVVNQTATWQQAKQLAEGMMLHRRSGAPRYNHVRSREYVCHDSARLHWRSVVGRSAASWQLGARRELAMDHR